MTVASACCAAVTTAVDAVAVDAAHRDDADVVADEAAARPRTAAGRAIALASCSFSLDEPSFSPWMRSDFASTVSRRLSSVSTTPRSMTPAPITTPSARARKIAMSDTRWNRKLIISRRRGPSA